MKRALVCGLIALVGTAAVTASASAQDPGDLLPPPTEVAAQAEPPPTGDTPPRLAPADVAPVARPRAHVDADTHLERPPNALLIAGLTTAVLGAIAVGLGLGFFAVAHPVLDTSVDMVPEDPLMTTTRSELRGVPPLIVGGVLTVVGASAFLVGLVMTVVGWLCPPRAERVAGP